MKFRTFYEDMNYEPVGKFDQKPEEPVADFEENIPTDARFYMSSDKERPAFKMVSEELNGVFAVTVKDGSVIWDKDSRLEIDIPAQMARVKSGIENEVTYQEVLDMGKHPAGTGDRKPSFSSFMTNQWAQQAQQYNIYT